MVSTCKITSDIPQALTFTVTGSAAPVVEFDINKFKKGGEARVLRPWNKIPADFSKS
jgi:hypothetical protein